jgi:plasmid stability protein
MTIEDGKPIHKSLSFGGGVQTGALLAMILEGDYERPDVVIFADPGWESKETYDFIQFCRDKCAEAKLPFITASAGNIRKDALTPGKRFASMPLHLATESGERRGMSRRQCTREYKVDAVNRTLRNYFKYPKGKQIRPPIENWLGISLDEVMRMKESRVASFVVRWPLIDLKMTRQDCLDYLAKKGWRKVAKSACIGCFAGDTKVITKDGTKPIKKLEGRATLLVPKNQSNIGEWKEVEVRDFGVQKLYEIVLRRDRTEKIIHATAEHRWVTRDRQTGVWDKWTLTTELKRGDLIPSSRPLNIKASRHPVRPSAVGIAHGFVYGDGAVQSRWNRPATLHIYSGGKDRALLPYFRACPSTRHMRDGKEYRVIKDLPRSWKKLPDLDESRSYLLGWLAGYFAADGSVSPKAQATLYSYDKDSIEFAEHVATSIGVQTSPVRHKRHKAMGKRHDMYMVGLYARDLPESFWLQKHHRVRVSKAHKDTEVRRRDWVIASVTPTRRRERVYCAVVPGREMFTLADGVVTGNCPYHNDNFWKAMKKDSPEEFEDACQFDDALRTPEVRKHMKLKNVPFIYGGRVPLREANFGEDQTDLFNNECEGMCGL